MSSGVGFVPGAARRTTSQLVLTMSLKSARTRSKPGTAVDDVLLAVAHEDPVVALVAVDGVAGGVVGTRHVGPREREQAVVAGAAVGDVATRVGEDHVVADAALLVVVTGPADEEIRAALAVGLVVAGAAEQAVAAVAAEQLVVALTAEEAIAADRVAGVRHVAGQQVVALAAVEPVGAGLAVEGVVAHVAPQMIGAGLAVEAVVAGPAEDPVAAVSGEHDVVAGEGADPVVAAERGDGVGVRGAAEAVRPLGTRDVLRDGRRGGRRQQRDCDRGSGEAALGRMEHRAPPPGLDRLTPRRTRPPDASCGDRSFSGSSSGVGPASKASEHAARRVPYCRSAPRASEVAHHARGA